MTYSLSKKSANLPLMEVNQKLLDQKGREQARQDKRLLDRLSPQTDMLLVS